jgi:predicted membrane-bound spermidine synthase
VLPWLAGDQTIVRPTLQLAVLSLTLILTLLMLVTVIVPLFVFSRRGLQIAKPSQHILYFALLGIGFLIVEVHLMQRLALLLGGQTMSVTVVLMTLLLSSGLGSAAMTRVFTTLKQPRNVAYLFCLVALLVPFFDGALYDAIALSLPLRIAIAMAITAPLGFLMGVWFPLGLDHLKSQAPDFVPWAWGVNGAFSVLAPILTIAVAVTVGQTLSYLIAIPTYLVAGVLADRLNMWNPSRRG